MEGISTRGRGINCPEGYCLGDMFLGGYWPMGILTGGILVEGNWPAGFRPDTNAVYSLLFVWSVFNDT